MTDPLVVGDEELGHDWHIDAVTLITVWLLLSMAIPSSEVIVALGGGGTLGNILGMGFFGWYLLNWIAPAGGVMWGRQPIRWAGVALLCAVLASYASANTQLLPTVEKNSADLSVLSLCGWLGLLLVAADGITSIERLKTLVDRMVLGASLIATMAIFEYFTSLDLAQYIVVPGLGTTGLYTEVQTFEGLNRPAATAVNPLELAAVLGIILPLALYRARHAPPGRRLRRWLQVVLIAGALPMTVSRTALLALVVCLVVLVPTWPSRERGRAYVLIVLAAGALRAVAPGLIGTLRNLTFSTGSDSDTISRTNALGAAGNFIGQHPLFGRGFGTFLPQIYRYLDDQWLGSLIETGIVGFCAMAALFVTGWSLARRARKASMDIVTRDLAQALAASVAIAAATFGTFDVEGFPMAVGITFLCLGTSAALWRLTRAAAPAAEPHPVAQPEPEPEPEPVPALR